MNITNVSPEFAKDLIQLVNSCKGITYNAKVDYTSKKTGQQTKFEYVTLDKIYAHVKSNNDFAILEPLGTNEKGQSALQIILIHKSGEAITSDYYVLRTPENASKQDEGAAITYTKRYALGSFLGLCTDEDNDANPDGAGMNAKTPKENKIDYRAEYIKICEKKGIDSIKYAQEHGINKQTTQEQYKAICESLLSTISMDEI